MSLDPLLKVYDEASRCNRCGYCQPTCPTYSLTYLERDVARGRNNLVRAVCENRHPMDRAVKSAIFGCLMCDACVTNCHPEVRTDQIIAAARAAYYAQFGRPAIQQVIFERLLPDPGVLGRLLGLARLGKNTRLSSLVRVLRILGWYGRSLATAEALLPRIPRHFLREMPETQAELAPGGDGLRVAYFVGCAINFAMPQVGLATLKLLRSAGCAVTMLDNVCCGLPPYAYGDLESARALARRNLDAIAEIEADVVLTECASCTSFLREYPHLFAEDPDARARAEGVARRVKDATQFLATMELPFQGTGRLRVTYHAPCHLSHYLKERSAPRQVLTSLPGVEFVELPEADWCCGGAGSYNLTHPDTSEQILDRKMANVRKTGAQVLATACPSCLMQLAYGVRRHKLNVYVKHVVELVAERISLPEQA
ncbi:MAG: (Fe-S)-binding protein [bacterium]|jgi:glycolate oxidase iron-sulfur subunit|nr:(Fe-S)-binding protein [candidate division KSB1 bacterium]MDH7558685.1 (Fe-S)-binding protein [bacterium]